MSSTARWSGAAHADDPGNDEAKQKEAARKLRGIKQMVEQEAAKAVAALPPTADALQKEQAKAEKTEELFSAYAKEYSACPRRKTAAT